MKTRSKLVVAVTAVFATAGLVSGPTAQAADTSTTFTLNAGGLTISAPVAADLGTDFTAAFNLEAELGTVTVTDQRGPVLGSWTATVSSTNFDTTGDSILNDNAEYWSGPPTDTDTNFAAVVTPGQPTAGSRQSLADGPVPLTAFSASGLVGNNHVSWAPNVRINIPSGAVAGTYSGSITHSVA